MQLQLWKFATITFGTNGKYVKKEDCHFAHDKLEKAIDNKLAMLAQDRNQKLLELKVDLLNHIDVKFELLRKG